MRGPSSATIVNMVLREMSILLIIFWSCKACNLIYFCDEDCKSKSCNQHQVLCNRIIIIQKQQRDKVIHSGTYTSVLSVKDEAKVPSLVSEIYLIGCQLNG